MKDLIIRSSSAEFLIFERQTHDKGIQVRFEDGDLWLTQKSIGELFDTTRNNITKAIKLFFRPAFNFLSSGFVINLIKQIVNDTNAIIGPTNCIKSNILLAILIILANTIPPQASIILSFVSSNIYIILFLLSYIFFIYRIVCSI